MTLFVSKAQHILITYTSIVHMTQAGFLSINTVYLAHFYCLILKKKLKNRSNFLDKCLILQRAKIHAWGTDTKALFAKCCLDI